ncbi:flagellar basal-body MS-ring/collar protein FliF [Methylocella sp.]|uniref:flagellar basal-body MS-ring/collar protein FliF n=1 Tax=Methylocella sp. TaxID=1978226 RepID=UPI003784AF18
MVRQKQIEQIWANLLKLGSRRLIALAMIGVTLFAMTGLAGYFLSRPSLETLYSGLDRQDVARIGAALKEAGVGFDVNAEGNTIFVRYGETARARMLLAEKGLPNSMNAGNELFDKLGSLGLTTFMQEVTRVRALEGELARTIQLMRGVKAARVHVVMPDEGSFRRSREPPSASVVIRTEMADDVSAAKSIRHLVASAVPGMPMEQVTVLNTEGVLLASGSDLADAAPGGMFTLERTVSQEILGNIRKTLTPYLGLRNFQVSVAARLNTDKRQTNETIYNPDSRVERSVKVTRQNQTTQNSVSQSPTTVERNLPQEQVKADDGKRSSEETKKSEELTNYEVSSKTVNTVSGGYAVENISVAVLINKAALAAPGGGAPAAEAQERQLDELRQLIASAAGANMARGDVVKITAVDFIDADRNLEPQPPPSIAEMLVRQSGNVLNAATILIVALLLIWFGLRPAARAIVAQSAPKEIAELEALENFSVPDAMGDPGLQLGEWAPEPEVNLIEDLTNAPRRSSQKRLEQIVDFNEEQAAAILKQWLRQGEYA